eukprot:c17056_g1_i1.p1 GENE.c17056_g1_i1~~c17056_g1_i1.p1  ORF type:complete len:152 (-),score=34.38 c17056_g1_i1:73-528(-)
MIVILIKNKKSEQDESPIFNSIEEKDFRTLTNFTASEFNILYSLVQEQFHNKWYKGRGKKPSITPRDLFLLEKKGEETEIEDELESEYWGILLDKGFQGAENYLRATIPQKRILDLEEEKIVDQIAKDRVIVENFYGRMKILWGMTTLEFR